MPRLRSYKWEALGKQGYAAWKRDRPEAIAFDTETTGVEWYDTPFCVSMAWASPSGNHGTKLAFFDLSDGSRNPERVGSIFRNTEVLIGHNLKFDLQKCILAGLLDPDTLTPERVEDTLALGHLLDEQRSNKLKDLAGSVLGLTTNEDKRLAKVRRELKLTKEDGYLPIYEQRPEVLVPYALKDAEFTWALWKRFTPQIQKHPELAQLYRLEMEGMLGILDMEARGMGVDIEYVKEQIKEYGGKILATERAIEDIVGKPVRTGNIKPKEKDLYFNPNSVPQKLAALGARGYEVENVQEATLAAIDDPLAQHFINLGKYTKLRSTYLMNIKAGTRDGVIHPNFRQHGTVTGRMSSGKASD